MGLMAAFTEVIAPVLLIGAAGYGLGRTRVVEARVLASLSAAVLVPALTFFALTTSTLPRAGLAQIAAYILLQFLLIGVIVGPAARAAGADRARTTGLLLASLFSNSGNAGLPLALFAGAAPGSRPRWGSLRCRPLL